MLTASADDPASLDRAATTIGSLFAHGRMPEDIAAALIQGYSGQLDMWLSRSAFEPTIVERLDVMFAAASTQASAAA